MLRITRCAESSSRSLLDPGSAATCLFNISVITNCITSRSSKVSVSWALLKAPRVRLLTLRHNRDTDIELRMLG
jgi:hypothetical protein